MIQCSLPISPRWSVGGSRYELALPDNFPIIARTPLSAVETQHGIYSLRSPVLSAKDCCEQPARSSMER